MVAVLLRYYRMSKLDMSKGSTLLRGYLELKGVIVTYEDQKGVMANLMDTVEWMIGKVVHGILEARHL